MPRASRVADLDIRLAEARDLDRATAVCLRSKAFWGYDDAFMAACREELTLTPDDLDDLVLVAYSGSELLGVIQLSRTDDMLEIEKLFVDPSAMRRGLGRRLFDEAIDRAVVPGVRAIRAEADPQAVPFYTAIGFMRVGDAPSGSIAGRTLPVLARDL